MRRMNLVGALLMLTCGCPARPGSSEPEVVELTYDFSGGRHDWQAGLADYNQIDGPNLEFRAEFRALPLELGLPGTGFYLQSRNTPDDLFTFIKRRLDTADGLEPGATYHVSYEIVFASNAPSGCSGIGGAPGESVFLKAGASADEPEPVLDHATLDYRLSVDKGNQSEGGPAASVAGDIANGNETGCEDLDAAPFASVTLTHMHTSPVTAGPDGSLWLLIGTDSGFEGTTRLYYQSVSVRLERVP